MRDPERGVAERELDHGLGVVRRGPGRPGAAPRAERVAAEERVEQVAEAGERVAADRRVRPRRRRRPVAEDVVAATALRIAQHLVGAR